jgi:hypothetical protein
MTSYTTIEIDEIETEIKIEFTNRFGEIEIDLITDITTGNAIAPDLLNEWNIEDLHEFAANQEFIPVENEYQNI